MVSPLVAWTASILRGMETKLLLIFWSNAHYNDVIALSNWTHVIFDFLYTVLWISPKTPRQYMDKFSPTSQIFENCITYKTWMSSPAINIFPAPGAPWRTELILCLPLDYHPLIVGDKTPWQKLRYMRQKFSPYFDQPMLLAFVGNGEIESDG